MNALTLRGIVAEELGSLRLHVVGKCGVLGELRKTCWTRELPGFGTRHYASGRKVYIVQARMIGKLLGHADVRTMTRYAHLDDGHVIEAAQRIGDQIEQSMSGSYSLSHNTKYDSEPLLHG